MLKAHVKSLTFKNNLTIPLNRDSIVILLGPNNSGKSATLNDVKTLISEENPATVSLLKLETFKESSAEYVKNLLKPFLQPNGYYNYFNNHFPEYVIQQSWQSDTHSLGSFASRLISDLSTRARLGDCDPTSAVDFRQPFIGDHPFQHMYRDPKLEARTSNVIRRAFKQDLVIHRSAGSVIPAYIGKRPELLEGELRDSQSYCEKIEKLPNLEKQGDGVRSFVSIVSRVITENRSIQLIDEPEAFLHPPQAKMVAETVAEESLGRQTFVATHSSDIVQGLLTNHSSRVSVVRLTRHNEKASASHLSSDSIADLWKDPILRFSKILDGLFHDGVIVTEADADCRFYEALAYASVPSGQQPDIHYTYSGGKDRIPTVVAALAGLKVPVATVVDFDALNNDQPLRRIVEAHGAQWTDIESDWKAVKLSVEAKSAFVGGREFRAEAEALIKSVSPDDAVSKTVLSQLKKLAKRASPWENVKSSGIRAVAPGEPTVTAKRLLEKLSSFGIFVAPEGEMEGFCRSIGGHGPRWVEAALRRDLGNDADFSDARKFMKKVIEYLRRAQTSA